MTKMERIVELSKEREPSTRTWITNEYSLSAFCHADYHKARRLAELARLLEIPRENIFAAGDHHNDISMLDGKAPRLPSCPANAIDEVQDAVRNAGGYVRAEKTVAPAFMKRSCISRARKLSGLKRLSAKRIVWRQLTNGRFR